MMSNQKPSSSSSRSSLRLRVSRVIVIIINYLDNDVAQTQLCSTTTSAHPPPNSLIIINYRALKIGPLKSIEENPFERAAAATNKARAFKRPTATRDGKERWKFWSFSWMDRGGSVKNSCCSTWEFAKPPNLLNNSARVTYDGDYCDSRQREWTTELLNWLVNSHWDRFLWKVHEMSDDLMAAIQDANFRTISFNFNKTQSRRFCFNSNQGRSG